MTATQIEPSTQPAKLLQSHVALVTGASRSIGAATARLLAHHGAAVGVNYYSSESAAQEVVDAIIAEGGKALAVKGDVREIEQVEAMVQQVTEAFGHDRHASSERQTPRLSQPRLLITTGKILRRSWLENSSQRSSAARPLFPP